MSFCYILYADFECLTQELKKKQNCHKKLKRKKRPVLSSYPPEFPWSRFISIYILSAIFCRVFNHILSYWYYMSDNPILLKWYTSQIILNWQLVHIFWGKEAVLELKVWAHSIGPNMSKPFPANESWTRPSLFWAFSRRVWTSSMSLVKKIHQDHKTQCGHADSGMAPLATVQNLNQSTSRQRQ